MLSTIMEKYILVEYLNSLNVVLSDTFKSTQRIKLTSFDVSNNYVIFGASSGGIYIFKRTPCEFIKLIPSKEGSTLQIKVSSDEKNLAIASAKGLVVILENFFVDLSLRPLVHNEHEGTTITALEWYGNYLYCGDDIGKISVFTVTSLLTKTIFQTPSAVLMHLDSSIVQIDLYLNYLLISTKTRTYLCDTDKEQYKQIGKKTRDGNFGACFCQISNNEPTNTLKLTRGTFRTLQEGEEFISSFENNDTKIFCARPGARLWEANFEAAVLKTYQFRNSSNQAKSDTFIIEDSSNAKLKFSSSSNGEEITKYFNFSKIYPIRQRFIFTYDSEGIYFFDPVTNNLTFWNSTLKNILDVKISNNYIFIWRKNFQMTIITIQSLEEIIISTLLNKQYYLCTDLCLHFINDLLNLIESNKSKKISLVIVLKDKLTEMKANNLLTEMNPIFDALEKIYKEYTLARRLDNGMFVVDCKYSTVQKESELYIPESVQNFEDTRDTESFSFRYTENVKLATLYKQFILNKHHKNAELTECCVLLEKMDINDMLLLLENFLKYVKETDGDDATIWCQEQLIKQASKDNVDIHKIEAKTFTFLSESFLNIYGTKDFSCKCNFPLPKAHLYKLDYYYLAVGIMDRLEKKCDYLNNIPYLYKHYLRKANNLHDIIINLSLITQFSDKDLFKEFTSTFTYDMWDDIIKFFIKLKNRICLKCGHGIDTEGILSWTDLGLLIVESVGPQNACTLFKRYSKYIPKGELDSSYYQSCIMVMVYEEPNLSVNFMEKFVNSTNCQQLEEMLGNFLQRKYLGVERDMSLENLEKGKCSLCNLPINKLILADFKKCNCGIYFHNICFDETNTICNNCIKIGIF